MTKEFRLAILASPKRMLERLIEVKNTDDTSFIITIYDEYGHEFSGKLIKYDVKNSLLFLYDENHSNSLLFIEVNQTSTLRLHNASDHIHILSEAISREDKESESRIDIESYINILQEMLKENSSLYFQFFLDSEQITSNVITENIRTVLENLGKAIVEISSDEFGVQALSNIDSFELSHSNDKSFLLKRNKSNIIIEFDFNKNLPGNFILLIENGLNKLL